jgi:hypothetical protein
MVSRPRLSDSRARVQQVDGLVIIARSLVFPAYSSQHARQHPRASSRKQARVSQQSRGVESRSGDIRSKLAAGVARGAAAGPGKSSRVGKAVKSLAVVGMLSSLWCLSESRWRLRNRAADGAGDVGAKMASQVDQRRRGMGFARECVSVSTNSGVGREARTRLHAAPSR